MVDKRLTSAVSGSMKYIIYNVLMQWISLIANIIIIFLVGNILSMILFDNIDRVFINKSILVFAILIVARFFSAILASRFSFLASKNVKLSLRNKIYNKLLSLGSAYNDSVSTSEVVQVAVEGVDQLEIYFGRYLPQLFYSLLAPLTLFIVLAFVNLASAIILFLCVPLIPISIVLVQKFAKKLLEKYWGKYTTLGDSFLENIEGLTTLKIYGADQEKNDEMNIEAEEFRKVTMKVLYMQLNSISIMDLIAFGGAALGVIISVLQFQKGNINFVETFAIIMLSAEFFIPLRQLGSYFHIAMNGMAASDKIFKILDLEVVDEKSLLIDDVVSNITLSNVDYCYVKNSPVLSNVSMTFNQGLNAIVGESGSGKSTIARILSGELLDYIGDITINGLSLKEINFKNLKSKLMVVGYDAYLFKGSVRDNLLMGNKEASEEMMIDVIKEVQLYNFLLEQNGLDSEVLENGSNLSGGQRQRLALARALLSDSDVYVFDEATSNIDTESEELIIETIKRLAKDKVVIVISHRLANIVDAENIFVLHKGDLKEFGVHNQLLENKCKYYKLYSTQQKLEQFAGGNI